MLLQCRLFQEIASNHLVRATELSSCWINLGTISCMVLSKCDRVHLRRGEGGGTSNIYKVLCKWPNNNGTTNNGVMHNN